MLEALRVDDHMLVRLGDHAHPENGLVDYFGAKQMCKDGQLVCPACALFGAKGEIYPRRDKRCGHWVHRPLVDKGCPRHTEPMSVAHYLAQLHIQQTLRTRYPQANVELETRLGSDVAAGRGDVTVQLADARVCIEVQRSSMSAGGVQGRIQNRWAAGWAIDWVFILEVDDPDWSKPVALDSKLLTALERRGYIYVLEDPYAPDPVLHIVVHRDFNRFIPRLRASGTLAPLPESLAHVLDVERRLSEFHVTPDGLRHPKLHTSLERWLRDGLKALTPPPFTPPDKTADAVLDWQQRRDALARDLSDATIRVRRVDDTVRGSENELQMAQTSLADADADRARTRLISLRRTKRRELDARRTDAAQWLLAAQTRLRDARDGSKRAHAARRRVASAFAANDLQRAAAEQADNERHEAFVEAARADHDATYGDEHALAHYWLAQLSAARQPSMGRS
jgi:hypothetical protein